MMLSNTSCSSDLMVSDAKPHSVAAKGRVSLSLFSSPKRNYAKRRAVLKGLASIKMLASKIGQWTSVVVACLKQTSRLQPAISQSGVPHRHRGLLHLVKPPLL